MQRPSLEMHVERGHRHHHRQYHHRNHRNHHRLGHSVYRYNRVRHFTGDHHHGNAFNPFRPTVIRLRRDIAKQTRNYYDSDTSHWRTPSVVVKRDFGYGYHTEYPGYNIPGEITFRRGNMQPQNDWNMRRNFVIRPVSQWRRTTGEFFEAPAGGELKSSIYKMAPESNKHSMLVNRNVKFPDPVAFSAKFISDKHDHEITPITRSGVNLPIATNAKVYQTNSTGIKTTSSQNSTMPEVVRQELGVGKNFVIRPVHRPPVPQDNQHQEMSSSSSSLDPVKSMLPSMPSMTSTEPSSSVSGMYSRIKSKFPVLLLINFCLDFQ